MTKKTKPTLEQQMLSSLAMSASRWQYDRRDIEAAMRSRAYELAAGDRSALHNAKIVVAAAKASPELLNGLADTYVRSVSECQSMLEDAQRNKDECPIDQLLNWETLDGRPFFNDVAYDLLGKEDARTLRALLRQVVEMIDPAKATEV